MGRLIIVISAVVVGLTCFAAEAPDKADPLAETKPLLRSIVQSLLDEGQPPAFEMADTLFAIDTGETMSKEELKKAWPEFRKVAFRKKVSVDEFFTQVQVQLTPAKDNKRLMSNPRIAQVYKVQDGDLYCDMSKVKEKAESFIGYDKAFIYILRKVEGKWTVIAIGG